MIYVYGQPHCIRLACRRLFNYVCNESDRNVQCLLIVYHDYVRIIAMTNIIEYNSLIQLEVHLYFT